MTTLRRFAAACAFAASITLVFAQDADAPDLSVRRLELGGPFGASAERAVRKTFDAISVAAVDSRGRIVVAGPKRVAAGRAPVSVARFLPNGRLDRKFGRRGVASLPVYGDVLDLTVDADDRVVGCGNLIDRRAQPFDALRLLEDGSLDPSFSEDGGAEMPGLTRGEWRFVHVSPDDGSILAVAIQADTAYLVRMTESGEPDATFGSAGIVDLGGPAFFWDGRNRRVLDFAVDGAGRAVVAGAIGVQRFAKDGAPDTAFGTDGLLVTAAGSRFSGEQIEIDAQGRIVALGAGDQRDEGVYRFEADGAPDLSFSDDGHAARARTLPDGVSRRDDRVLAISADAPERYVVAFSANGSDAGDFSSGYVLQSIDPSAPEGLGLLDVRPRSTHRRKMTIDLRGVVMAPGGQAVVVGEVTTNRGGPPLRGPVLRSVDPRRRGAVDLPELDVAFARPLSVEEVNSLHILTTDLVISNRGARDWWGGDVSLHLSADDVLDASDLWLGSFPMTEIRAGQTRVHLTTAATVAPVSGMRLIAAVDLAYERLVGDLAGDVVASEPIQ